MHSKHMITSVYTSIYSPHTHIRKEEHLRVSGVLCSYKQKPSSLAKLRQAGAQDRMAAACSAARVSLAEETRTAVGQTLKARDLPSDATQP